MGVVSVDTPKGTVFRIQNDGLDTAAFLAGVRRVVIGNAQLDSIVSAAVVRHIDFLLSRDGVADSDPRLDERARQVDTGLRNVLLPTASTPTAARSPQRPSTAAFKRVISDGRQAPQQPAPPSPPARDHDTPRRTGQRWWSRRPRPESGR